MLQAQGSRVPAPAGLFSTVAGEARGQDVIEAELGRRYTYCVLSVGDRAGCAVRIS